MKEDILYLIKNIGIGPTSDYFAIAVANIITDEISYGLINKNEHIKRGDFVVKIKYDIRIDDILGDWELANQFQFKTLFKKAKSVKTKKLLA